MLPVEYLKATQSAQQELVLLHGWGSNRNVWRPLLVQLRPWANITLIDIPGCAPGVLPENELSMGQLLGDILECCPEQAVFVGWSLGGQIATELANNTPDRVTALVTLCSNPKFVAAADWPGMPPDTFNEFRSAVESQPNIALKRFDSLQTSGSEQPRHLLRQLQQLQRDPCTDEMNFGLRCLESFDQRAILVSLSQPQLHLLAAADGLVPIAVEQAMKGLFEQVVTADVEVVAKTSHLAPIESPQAVAFELRRFLGSNKLLLPDDRASSGLEKQEVAASFSRAAGQYDSVAHLQRDVGSTLLARLDQWQGQPETILDLGCGTGYFHAALSDRYPSARYIGLDIAQGMIDYARQRCADDCQWLVADAESIPIASDSVDLIFSSLAVQWCQRPAHLFAELSRVLRPGGLCVFTSLGPDTLCELRAAWASVDAGAHVNTFIPVADLIAAADTVPDIEMTLQSELFLLNYDKVRDLLTELKTLGAHNMNKNRPVGLTSRRTLQGMFQAYEEWRGDDGLPASYDAIFGVLEKV